MRFLSMVKAKEGGPPPSQKAMDDMEKWVGEAFAAGWLLSVAKWMRGVFRGRSEHEA